MPMGLKNAPLFFRRMMEIVLFTPHPELHAFVSVYIDDIIIATEVEGLTEEGLVALHEKQLNQVMDILDANRRRENCFQKLSNLVVLFPRMVHADPVQGSSSLFRSGSALGLLRVPLSEIGGVLPGTREVGGVDQSTALFARVEAFWLRCKMEALSDMLRKVEAEARKVAEAQGEDVASESSAGRKSSVLPAMRAPGRPPKVPGKVPGVSCFSCGGYSADSGNPYLASTTRNAFKGV